jgi:hypothetical protein
MTFIFSSNSHHPNLYSSPPQRSRNPQPKRIYALTTLAFLLSLIIYLITHPISQTASTLPTIPWTPTRTPADIRIAKAAILYTSSDNRSLALRSARHDRFGHPMHVLRVPIVRGFANTLLWLQHIIVKEIVEKTVEERAEWIL